MADHARRRLSGPQRASWMLADQILSSATNFAGSLVVARNVSLVEFGAFTIAITTYYVLVELVRPLALEPLLIRYSGDVVHRFRSAASGAASTALAVGVVAGVGLALVAALVGGELASLLLVAAVIMPGLLLQDACRYALIACGDTRGATMNDGVWAVSALGSMTVALLAGGDEPATLLGAWGAGGILAGIIGLVQLRVLPRPAALRWWLRHNRDLSPRFVAEYLIDAGVFQLTFLLVGIVGGLEALAALNGARLLLGPVGVVYLALSGLAVSEGARLRDAGHPGLVSAIRLLGVALAVLPLLWMALLVLLPSAAGTALLGSTYVAAQPVLPLLGLYWAARGAILGAKWAMRIFSAASASLTTMAAVAPVTLIGGVLGAASGGAPGAAGGLALASAIAAVVWWWRLQGVERVQLTAKGRRGGEQ